MGKTGICDGLWWCAILIGLVGFFPAGLTLLAVKLLVGNRAPFGMARAGVILGFCSLFLLAAAVAALLWLFPQESWLLPALGGVAILAGLLVFYESTGIRRIGRLRRLCTLVGEQKVTQLALLLQYARCRDLPQLGGDLQKLMALGLIPAGRVDYQQGELLPAQPAAAEGGNPLWQLYGRRPQAGTPAPSPAAAEQQPAPPAAPRPPLTEPTQSGAAAAPPPLYTPVPFSPPEAPQPVVAREPAGWGSLPEQPAWPGTPPTGREQPAAYQAAQSGQWVASPVYRPVPFPSASSFGWYPPPWQTTPEGAPLGQIQATCSAAFCRQFYRFHLWRMNRGALVALALLELLWLLVTLCCLLWGWWLVAGLWAALALVFPCLLGLCLRAGAQRTQRANQSDARYIFYRNGMLVEGPQGQQFFPFVRFWRICETGDGFYCYLNRGVAYLLPTAALTGEELLRVPPLLRCQMSYRRAGR